MQITAPVEEEISLPADGLLAVDATVSDDFGLKSVTLRIQQIDDKGGVVRSFKSKPYRDGKPFLRESDGTYPTRMEYKDSVALAALTVDLGNQPAELKEGMVLQYWLEAKDNCTVTGPNTGESARKRVKIAAQPKEPEKQQQQKQAQQQRGSAEQKHQQQQDQQLQSEKRDPPPQLRPEEKSNTEPKEGQPGTEGPKQDTRAEGPKQSGDTKPKGSETPEPKHGGTDENPMQPKGTPSEPMPQPGEPKTPPETGAQPRETHPQPQHGESSRDAKSPPEKGNPPPQGDPKQVEQKAQDVQNAIEQQNRQPGGGRNQDPDQAKPAEAPADKKPTGQPPSDGQAEQKAGQPTDPKGQPMGDPSGESKPQGNLEQPKPSDTKPEPKPGEGNPQQPNQQSSSGSAATGDTPKHPPVAGNTPAQERPQPKAGEADPKPPSGTGDKKPGDAGAARGAEMPPQGQPERGQPAGETKPKPETNRGQERSKDGAGSGQSQPEQQPAEARGPKPTDPGARKQPPAGNAAEKTPATGEKPQPGTEGSDPQKSPADMKPEGGKPQPGTNATEPKTGQPSPGEKAAEKSAQPSGSGQGEKKVDPKEIAQAASDLASGDPQRQQAARDKLDNIMGKEAREQAERDAKQLADDLKSGDPEKRKAAEQKLRDLAKQAEKHAGQSGQEASPKVDPKEIAQAAQDLASDNPEKQQAARDKLDKIMGKEARERAEREAKQLKDDLASKDPATRQAAEQKLKDLARQAEKQAGQGNQGAPLSDAEKQKFRDLAKDLTSDDPAKREAAEKEFDKAIGQERRQQLQQMAKDAQSGDPERQKAAKQKFEEMMQNAGQGSQGQQPSAEELKKWAEKAQELNSPDQGRREAAEKEFDDKFGKEARQQLQKDMQDPKKLQEARKKLQEMAGKLNKDLHPGGGASRGQEGSLHKEDPRNRLKSAELQLKTFEENRNNKDLQNKLGWTQEEYDRFLTEQQKRVAQLREEAAKQEQPEAAPTPTGPAPLRVGEGTNNRKVDTRSDGTAGTSGGAGPGTAPAGYSDAQRKFAEEAARLRKGQDKK